MSDRIPCELSSRFDLNIRNGARESERVSFSVSHDGHILKRELSEFEEWDNFEIAIQESVCREKIFPKYRRCAILLKSCNTEISEFVTMYQNINIIIAEKP